MSDAMKRAVRLLRIIELLRERAHTTDELADRLRVSQRTIQRDLADLQGDPLYAPLVCQTRQTWRVCEANASDVN